jgi:CheY-like chemotaxis protein
MSGKAILVVEDNEVQRAWLTEVLFKAGYLVVPVADGKEAVALMKSGVAPNLILMDMMIPPPDGWYLLTMRKKMPALASVPVIIMTSLGIASEEWATSLGACGLIRKPVEVEPLLAEVRRCLDECQG